MPIIGCVERDVKIKKTIRVKMVMEKGLKATDKGASRRFCKRIDKIKDEALDLMTIEEIVSITMETVKDVSKGRRTNSNPNGFSIASRILSMRISVHATACKLQGMKKYDSIMIDRVKNLRRAEKKIKLSEEETEWLGEHGVNHKPLDWVDWKRRYSKGAGNMDHLCLLKRLNNGKRRTELKLVRSDRTSRIQSDADAGRTGGVISKVVGIKRGFNMESLSIGDEIITDGSEICSKATEKFNEWFHRSQGIL